MTTNNRTAASAADAAFTVFETRIGACAVVWRDGRIIGSALPDESESALRAGLASRFPAAAESSTPSWAADAVEKIVRLINGERIDFTGLEVDFGKADEFALKVYAAVRRIPCGQVRTYGQVAAEIEEPGAARAVGAALGRNPVPIIVPCHRILAAGGRSGGFSAPGGTAIKFKLLEIEGARREGDPELFESLPLAVRAGARS